MSEKTTYSEEDIRRIIDKVDEQNFILANIARMVYYAAFLENEVIDIKIRNVIAQGRLVTKIQPFMPKTGKGYTLMPIIIQDPAKSFLEDHMKDLQKNNYDMSDDAPLFPNKRTRKVYARRTLIDQFGKHFEGITISKLRKFGIEREYEKLTSELSEPYQIEKELIKYARHLDPNTTKKLLSGKVNKAGRHRKQNKPWESIVRSVEQLTQIEEAGVRTKESKELKKKISNLDSNKGIKDSLLRLLREYTSRPSTTRAVFGSDHFDKSLSQLISKGISEKPEEPKTIEEII